VIYIPIEIKNREYFSRLILAGKLANKGLKVLIGQQWAIQRKINELPKGLFLFKGYNSVLRQAARLAKSLGHAVTVLDEEMYIHSDTYTISNYINNIEELNLYDRIYVNNVLEQQVLEKSGVTNTKATGNPRIDLLRYPGREIFLSQIESIKEKFAKFILINTAFVTTNSGWGSFKQAISAEKQTGGLKHEDDILAFKDRADYERYAIRFITRLISRIPTDVRLIIRPHPAENRKYWMQFANSHNVYVEAEGAHFPWTLAADVLVHAACTTGVEALIAGKRSLTIDPGYENRWLRTLAAQKYCEKISSMHPLPWEDEPSSETATSDEISKIMHPKVPCSAIDLLLTDLLEIYRPTRESHLPVEWGEEVQQLSWKCNIQLSEVDQDICRIASLFRFKSRPNISQVGKSLFLLH
jgi:surface carbohydrate biosynthesis protein